MEEKGASSEMLYRCYTASPGWIRGILYVILCPAILVSFLLESFTPDIRIYLGVERIAARMGTFPTNLDSVWEVKPVGNRLIFYVLNWIADPYFGTLLYQVLVKGVAAAGAVLILWWFARMVSKEWHVPFEWPFMLGFVGLFAIGNYIILESEWFATVLVLLMVALLLRDTKFTWCAAGLLVVPLLLIKGITVLMAPLPLIAYVLISGRWKGAASGLPRAICGMVAGGILAGLAWLTIFPHMVQDMFLSAAIGKVAAMGLLERVDWFIVLGFGVVGFTPLIVIGAVTGFMGCCFAQPRDRRDLGLLLLLWLVAVSMAFIQGEFFYYHYFPMTVAAIFTCLWALKRLPWPGLCFLAILIITVGIWAGVVAGWSPGLQGQTWAFWNERNRGAVEIDARFNLSGQPEMLYLDPGDAPWYFGTPSACRYVAPLPIQRNTPEWDMTGAPGYWDDWTCTMAYQGEYIIANNAWMKWNLTTHRPLKEKIDAGWVQVWDSGVGNNVSWQGLDVYRRKAEVL